jgi:polar amino acid transport system permease protein
MPAGLPAIFQELLSAFGVNLLLAALGFAGALLLGLGLFFALRALPRAGCMVLQAFLLSVKVTPVIIQLFLVFFVLPEAGIRLDAVSTGLLVLSIHYAAFFVEIFHGAWLMIEDTQFMALKSLGLSRIRSWISVIIPQIMIFSFPALINMLVGLFKDTAILSAIAVQDVVFTAKSIGSMTYDYTAVFLIAGFLFLIATVSVQLPLGRLEHWLRVRYGLGLDVPRP